MRLLQEYLVTARRDYITDMRAYFERRACASYAMYVAFTLARFDQNLLEADLFYGDLGR